MKRVFSILICLFFCTTICLPLIAIQGKAATPALDFDFDASTGTITGYHGPNTDVDIPSTIGGVSVVAIGEHAFSQQIITSVIIPNSVTKIRDLAFFECHLLKKVTLGNHIILLGTGAFEDCNSLTNINLPDSLTNLLSSVFHGCTKLTTITLPPNLTNIGMFAFASTGLTHITFPNSVEVIEDFAFNGCISLTSATFTGNAPYITDNSAFYGTDPSFMIYYYEESTGFTTPSYEGYPCFPLYRVTVSNNMYRGNITCEDRATPGSVVHLTVLPDLGYALSSLYYMDALGKHVISGTSFVMPANDVTIYAKFTSVFVYLFFAISIVFLLGVVAYGLWMAFRNSTHNR
jgi:hypothetical protein